MDGALITLGAVILGAVVSFGGGWAAELLRERRSDFRELQQFRRQALIDLQLATIELVERSLEAYDVFRTPDLPKDDPAVFEAVGPVARSFMRFELFASRVDDGETRERIAALRRCINDAISNHVHGESVEDYDEFPRNLADHHKDLNVRVGQLILRRQE